jgi:hypothetical protein
MKKRNENCLYANTLNQLRSLYGMSFLGCFMGMNMLLSHVLKWRYFQDARNAQMEIFSRCKKCSYGDIFKMQEECDIRN